MVTLLIVTLQLKNDGKTMTRYNNFGEEIPRFSKTSLDT